MTEVSLKDALSEIVFSCRVLSQGRDATIAEIDGFLSGPIATALATAVAHARREALEEAKTACLDLSDAYRETGEHHMGVGPKGPDPVLTKAAEALAWARGATECAHALTKLAATPPEDRQTETGWRDIASAPNDETDVLLFGTFEGRPRPPLIAGWFEKYCDDPGWYSHDDINNRAEIEPTHWMPLPAPPSPAIGNLDGEVRS